MTGIASIRKSVFNLRNFRRALHAPLLCFTVIAAGSTEPKEAEPNEPASSAVDGAKTPSSKGKIPKGSKEHHGEIAPGGEKSNANVTWDSYLDFTDTEGVANEVSSGIRVEDIVEPPSQYRYAAFGRPDPFVPPMLTGYKSNNLEIPIVSILQKYNIESLRVVGMWELSNGERKALIMTAKDEGVVSKIGDIIGPKGGKIIQIDGKSVKIREFMLAPDGTRQFEDSEMFLGPDRPDDVGTLDRQSISGKSTTATGKDSAAVGLLDRELDVVKRNEITTITAPAASVPISEPPKAANLELRSLPAGTPAMPNSGIPATAAPGTSPSVDSQAIPSAAAKDSAGTGSATVPVSGGGSSASGSSTPAAESKGTAGTPASSAVASPVGASRFNSGY